MNIVEIFKSIINEFLETKGLSDIEIATIETIQPLSIKLANDKILPKNFLEFTSKMNYLKNTENEMELNSKILIQKKLGGQKYIVLDKYEDTTIGNSISTIESINPIKIRLANGKVIEKYMIFSKPLKELKNTSDTSWIGKRLITIKETGTDNYLFIAESE